MKDSAFRGFPPAAISFFRGLRRNNDRDWFQARKEIYETSVKAPMAELVDAVNRELADWAPQYVTDAKKAVYRIYRDTRFSPNKTPYKDHAAAIFTRRGLEKHAAASLYFSVSDKEIEIAGGVYMPGPEQLLAIRTHIARHHPEFRRLIAARNLQRLMGEMKGDRLSRVPKGFPADHPAADLVRHKQWLYYVLLKPGVATTPRLIAELVRRFQSMLPFVEFLNSPLVAHARRRDLSRDLLG